ncbi:SRPBCC domain-containing protein [Chitinophaga nivalis]|uniref:SRPBCC domain-containing protein n=1 Tax=Chitinophaga nivalis TaxID=2991709 RepID=A0ABT3IQ87_9BACT|nr:SRPBCC domain-containing protein [Chitinophaga nivalis]MCW3464188.1 SRPBCC domain-containing protein [Chitinophaga nivalis]MCW3486122.1 SRPBCC domain-containing protein [Chitinophaga nivalis]
MEKQQFHVTIDATRERVWEVLWGDTTYPAWTAAFCAGSRAETDWKEGSKALFLGDTNDGMVAIIAASVPAEFMSFRHIGEIKDGVEDVTSDRVKEWAGAMENYTLKTVNGQTEVTIDIDVAADYKEYFMTTWPKALDTLKAIAENKA